MTVPADNRLSPDNQRLIETVRFSRASDTLASATQFHAALDLIAARLARLETLERAVACDHRGTTGRSGDAGGWLSERFVTSPRSVCVCGKEQTA